MIQLGVTIEEAFLRLRAYAFAHDRRLPDVAADVVARRLRFE
jgi:AmiR/NasT family two-component response regulator